MNAPVVAGGRTRIRTLDPLIKSQLLYQLSYAPGRDAVAGPYSKGGRGLERGGPP